MPHAQQAFCMVYFQNLEREEGRREKLRRGDKRRGEEKKKEKRKKGKSLRNNSSISLKVGNNTKIYHHPCITQYY